MIIWIPLILVVFILPLYLSPIRHPHHPPSMLDPLNPVPLITRSVCPPHFSFPVSLVILKLSFIQVTWSPSVDAFSTFLVIPIFSFIWVSDDRICILLPFTVSMLQSFHKVSNIDWPIFPFIGTMTIRRAFLVVTTVLITICKCLCPSPMLHKLEPLSFIFITIWPYMNSMPMCLWVFPFTNIMVSFSILPKTLPFFHPCNPVSIIYLTVSPFINPSSVGFPIHEVTSIYVSRGVSFISLPMSNVFYPESLV